MALLDAGRGRNTDVPAGPAHEDMRGDRRDEQPIVRRTEPDQLFNATSTSSSIFFASPNSIRLFSL
jgi:hypothetical protein